MLQIVPAVQGEHDEDSPFPLYDPAGHGRLTPDVPSQEYPGGHGSSSEPSTDTTNPSGIALSYTYGAAEPGGQ